MVKKADVISMTHRQHNARILETATVLSVIDGNTLKVNYQERKENIRLIGIHTPDSRDNNKVQGGSNRSRHDINIITANDKTEYLKKLVKPGDKVTIEFDVQHKDKDGNLLVYAYLINDKMLNEETLKAGYDNFMEIQANTKYQSKFLKAYRKAKEDKGKTSDLEKLKKPDIIKDEVTTREIK